MAPIRLFVTGGTFDKEYNELAGTLAFKETHLVEMLRLGTLPARRVDSDADDDRQPRDDGRRSRGYRLACRRPPRPAS